MPVVVVVVVVIVVVVVVVVFGLVVVEEVVEDDVDEDGVVGDWSPTTAQLINTHRFAKSKSVAMIFFMLHSFRFKLIDT